jgi:hypothetical protein
MPRFFLSYRRSDTEGQYLAHMVFRELRIRYGPKSVFLDVDSRSPGLSFPKKVKLALDQSDAVLVVIGPGWLPELVRRKDDERDWVRYEVAEALKRENLPVVPICHSKASLPASHELPPEVQELVWRDGVILDPFQDFDSHLTRMLADLEQVLADSRSGAAGAQAPGGPAPPPQPVDADTPRDRQLPPAAPRMDPEQARRLRSMAVVMHGTGYSEQDAVQNLRDRGVSEEAALSVVRSVYG